MTLLLFSFSLFFLFVVGFGTFTFAENTYFIKMPSGSSDPDAPYFWSERTTGNTTGEITVFPNDSVTWENADTAFHTITSISASGEIDGIFDSGFINAGDSYTRQFMELGDFYYFCSIHPWMNGVVHVIKNPGSVQSLHNVGSGYDEQGIGFEVKYILDVNIEPTVHVNPNESTLTFRIAGDTQNDQIIFVLPSELIENPNAVWIDNNMVEFDIESTSTGTKLIIPIEPNSKEIRIMGTYVIPEFGMLTIGILSIGLFSSLFLFRSKFSLIRQL